jgi:hypothetical protein
MSELAIKFPCSLPLFAIPNISETSFLNAVKGIAALAKSLLSNIQGFVEIPLSFVGSKYPTISEVLIRASNVFKKIISKQEVGPLKKELFETGWSYISTDISTDISPQNLKGEFDNHKPLLEEALLHSCLYAYNHGTGNPRKDQSIEQCKKHFKETWLPLGYEEVHDFRDNGLRITFIQNEGKLHVVFGAKSAAGKEFGSKNVQETLTTMAGGFPEIFKRAHVEYQKIMNDQFLNWDRKNVVLSGLCLGGALASYVALKSPSGENAITLNPLGLSPRMQWDIGREVLSKAKERIKIYSVNGDFASAPLKPVAWLDVLLNFIGIRTVGNFGKRYHMQPAPSLRIKASKLKNFDGLHVKIYSSIYYQLSGKDPKDNKEITKWLKSRTRANSV